MLHNLPDQMMIETESSPHTIFFLHIPKTAGTTLHHILMRQYLPAQQYSDEFWDPEAATKFGQLPAEKKGDIRIVWGHFSFGLHKLTPYSSAYFTFLRDPVDRVLSHYYYHLSRPDIFPLQAVMARENLTMHQVFARRKIEDIKNMQTRLLAGLPYHFPWDDYTEAHLEMAKENLRKQINVIGLVEQFDYSLLLLQDAFNWPDVYYRRHNVTKKRTDRADVSPETIALIEEQEALDRQLYAYAQQLFAEQIARQPASFHRRVQMFRWFNPVAPTWRKANRRLNQSPLYVRTRYKITAVKQKVGSFFR